MGDSEAGSIISFGAVAVIAVLGYKKLSEFFGGASSSSGSGSTVSSGVSSDYVDALIEKRISSVTTDIKNEASVAAKASAQAAVSSSWLGQSASIGAALGKSLSEWLDSKSQLENVVSGVSKTYGTGDTDYDKYVDSLTNEWVAKIEANKATASGSSVSKVYEKYDLSVAATGIDKFTEAYASAKKQTSSTSSSSGIKRQGGSGTGEDKVRIIKKV